MSKATTEGTGTSPWRILDLTPGWRASVERDLGPSPQRHLDGATISVYGTQVVLPNFRKSVKRGARMLDAQMPGWWQHINTSSLDLSDENLCVLGQTWHHYQDGQAAVAQRRDSNYRSFLGRLFGTTFADKKAVRRSGSYYGFDISPEEGLVINYQAGWTGDTHRQAWAMAWEQLTKTWLRLIAKRQSA